MNIEKYWKEGLIIVLLLLLVLPFWRNHIKPPCPVITEVRTVTDTCWLTEFVKPKLATGKRSVFVNDTIKVTVYTLDENVDSLPKAQATFSRPGLPGCTISTNVYIDTIDLGNNRLAYAHLVTGTLDSSIYSIVSGVDTVYKTVETYKTQYREPFLEFFATARTAGNNIAPGVMLQSRRWMVGYGFDLINGRHEITAGYRIGKIK